MVRSINICPVLNGFVVNVGCQTVVFTSSTNLAQAILNYYRDPDAVEAEYIKNAVNKTMQSPMPEPVLAREEIVDSPEHQCANTTSANF